MPLVVLLLYWLLNFEAIALANRVQAHKGTTHTKNAR
jgi:hypothetical protein